MIYDYCYIVIIDFAAAVLLAIVQVVEYMCFPSLASAGVKLLISLVFMGVVNLLML